MAKINNVHKDEPDTFDVVKVNTLDDKTRNGNNYTVLYKGGFLPDKRKHGLGF